MDMSEDLRPTVIECPNCGEELEHLRYVQSWKEEGCVNQNDTYDTTETTEFYCNCPHCDWWLENIASVSDAQDYLMGIGRE